jgi:glutamine amidotransferase
MSAAPHRVHARFWLIDASDSLLVQSHRNPDGTGLGHFRADGRPVVEKEAVAAYEDSRFAGEAAHVESATFVAHVRHASTGGIAVRNSHPFTMDGRIFAHNGAIAELERLEGELGDAIRLVKGDTDSERIFALITTRIAAAGGDVAAGLAGAVGWIARHLPVYALNVVLATPTDLWALRYPETHDLFVLDRSAGGVHGGRPLHMTSPRLGIHSDHLAGRPAVVVASERLDEHPGWRLLRSGELLHAGPGPRVESRVILAEPPAHPIGVTYLQPPAGD